MRLLGVGIFMEGLRVFLRVRTGKFLFLRSGYDTLTFYLHLVFPLLFPPSSVTLIPALTSSPPNILPSKPHGHKFRLLAPQRLNSNTPMSEDKGAKDRERAWGEGVWGVRLKGGGWWTWSRGGRLKGDRGMRRCRGRVLDLKVQEVG